jgi:predicted Zn-dependent protease
MKLLSLLLLAALLPAQEDPAAAAARAMREGRFADAERLYRGLIKDVPNEPRLQLNLALALHSGKKYADANLAFAQFLKTNPPPGPVHLVAGLSLLKANRPCDAVAVLEKAKRWQASEQVLTELADAYSACKRYPQAGATYSEAAAKATANAGRLKRAAARAYWLARDYAAAQPLFAALRPTFSNDAEFLYEFGDTLARTEGSAAGLPLLERSVALAPELTPARGALGRALVEAGRHPEAIPHLVAASPTDATLLMPLSRAYKATGRVEDAARAEQQYRNSLAPQN